MIDEKKLIEDLKAKIYPERFGERCNAMDVISGVLQVIFEQPKIDWIPCEDVLSMSESDFITHILSTICDYAKVNNYEITETVKAMGENLIALTEIANFDKWKEGVTDDE